MRLFCMRNKKLADVNPEASERQDMVELDGILASAERVISKWNFIKPSMFKNGKNEDVAEYFQAVEAVRFVMERLFVSDSNSKKIVHAQNLMNVSMNRLQTEFETILSKIRIVPVSDERVVELPSPETVLLLQSIAERMVSTGHGLECAKAYQKVRGKAVRDCLQSVGFSDLVGVRGTSNWAMMEKRINVWINLLRVGTRTVFASEWKLCEAIFARHRNLGESCFAAVTRDEASAVLGFGDRVLKACKHANERVFTILEMYEALEDVAEAIMNVFCQESCLGILSQASTILLRLADTIRLMLVDFEGGIQKENSRNAMANGEIHPLTSYVLDYLCKLSEHKKALGNIMAFVPLDVPKNTSETFLGELKDTVDDTDAMDITNSLSIHLKYILIILMCKLDNKAMQFKDVVVSNVFLMNNLCYIMSKVHNSQLQILLGTEWTVKAKKRIKRYAVRYEKAGWKQFLSFLEDEEKHLDGDGGMSQMSLTDRLNGVNVAVEDTLKRHSEAIVPDIELREMLRASIKQKVIPSYRSLISKYQSLVEHNREVERIIKYSPADLDDILSYMFEDAHSSRHSSSSFTFNFTPLNDSP